MVCSDRVADGDRFERPAHDPGEEENHDLKAGGADLYIRLRCNCIMARMRVLNCSPLVHENPQHRCTGCLISGAGGAASGKKGSCKQEERLSPSTQLVANGGAQS